MHRKEAKSEKGGLGSILGVRCDGRVGYRPGEGWRGEGDPRSTRVLHASLERREDKVGRID